MADALNYQPSNSAVYYTPPRRIYLWRTIIAFAGAAGAAMLGAFFYARIQPELNNFYLRVGAVVAAAIAVGALGYAPVHFGKVRLPVVAAFLGAALAMLTLYVMWVTWVHDALNNWGLRVGYWPLVTHPVSLFRLIRFINSSGTWSYKGEAARGLGLFVFWLGEAGAILACGVFFPLKAIGTDDPTCRECGSACKLVRPIPHFAFDRQDEMIATVQNRQFQDVALHGPPQNDDEPHLSLRLLSCPRCAQTNILTLNRVSWTVDINHRPTVKITPLVNQLLVTPDESEELKKLFNEIVEQRAAGESTRTDSVEPAGESAEES